MPIFEIILISIAISILVGAYIRVGREGKARFVPDGRAKFIDGKWRVK